MMWIPAQQMSVVAGSEIKLVCYVESHPEALTFWEHNGRMLQPSSRISIRNQIGSPRYKVQYPGVDFISPFKLYAKLLCSEPNTFTPKKLLKSWAQNIKWLCPQLSEKIVTRVDKLKTLSLDIWFLWIWKSESWPLASWTGDNVINAVDIFRMKNINLDQNYKILNLVQDDQIDYE